MIDLSLQGEDDKYLKDHLLPQNFEAACRKVGVPLLLWWQPGYDHAFHFISTFIDDRSHSSSQPSPYV